MGMTRDKRRADPFAERAPTNSLHHDPAHFPSYGLCIGSYYAHIWYGSRYAVPSPSLLAATSAPS